MDTASKEIRSPAPSAWHRMMPVAIAVVTLAWGYGIFRYHILRGVDWIFLPLYTTNKAIAFASVIFISLSYLLGPLHIFDRTLDRNLSLRKPFGLTGFGLASVHSLLSLVLLDPYYYPSLFVSGRFNLFAQIHLLTGIFALGIFTLVAVSAIPSIMQSMEPDMWRKIQRSGYLGLLAVAVHVYTVGARGWIDPTKWPGGLVPISLLTFCIILFVLYIKLISLFFSYRHANS